MAYPDPAWYLRAGLDGSPNALAAGDYTLVLVLADSTLATLLGPSATVALRSSPVLIHAGAPASQNEQLNLLLRAGERAAAAQQWTEAHQRAQDILAIYPTSVHALRLEGQAQEGLGDVNKAIAAWESALAVVDAGTDTASPEFALPATKTNTSYSISEEIEDLKNPEQP